VRPFGCLQPRHGQRTDTSRSAKCEQRHLERGRDVRATENAVGRSRFAGGLVGRFCVRHSVAAAAEPRTKAELTDEEFAAKVKRDADTRNRAVNAVGSFRNDNAWLTRTFRQTSLIIDPPDGRAPALVAGAEKRRTPQGTYGNGPLNGPEDFTLYDRCITLGVVGSMTPKIYGNGYRIVQSPGYVVLMAEMIHEARVIPLDGRAHVASGVRGYMGDSRGHFEGNTLVIETTNFNGKATVPGNPILASTELKIVERITRVEADLLRYEATITDPRTYTKPFTISIPYTSPAGYQVLPYECHEGNLAVLQGLGVSAPKTRRSRRTQRKGSSVRAVRFRASWESVDSRFRRTRLQTGNVRLRSPRQNSNHK
jgi:hypothetical protein